MYSIAKDLTVLLKSYKETEAYKTLVSDSKASESLDPDAIKYGKLKDVRKAALGLQRLTQELCGLVQSMPKLPKHILWRELAGEEELKARGLLNSIFTQFNARGDGYDALHSAIEVVEEEAGKADDDWCPDFGDLKQNAVNLCSLWEELVDIVIAIAPQGQCPYFGYPFFQVHFMWGEEGMGLFGDTTPSVRFSQSEELEALVKKAEAGKDMPW